MNECRIRFLPQNREVAVQEDTTLLEAVSKASITINNLCGGDGICGRCKMIILNGNVSGGITKKLAHEEIHKGYVLTCMTTIKSDLIVEIPEETMVQDRTAENEDTKRFIDLHYQTNERKYTISPLTKKGSFELQRLLIKDINDLIHNIANGKKINLKDITAIVCAGNTAMSHFLLGLPTESIRRNPYIPVSVEPPPLRAGLVGLIPESGPHLVFVLLFSRSLVPFSVLMASSIVQDGHGMLPLLSYSIKDSILIKIFNLIIGLGIGFILYFLNLYNCLVFKNGEVGERVVGAISKKEIEKMIKPFI
ncbi:MAG: 2Fe-2S iron-sulfur cluster binding domain-containing protein [Spirochaetales bacterium]|nr:2Fe-2S iron-sulfur cluster binding domain-containing protein [Spirochaetales bacterium]